MVFGGASGTLWGVLKAGSLVFAAAFLYLGRRRRRGAHVDQQSTWGTVLVFGGIYGVTYAANQLLGTDPSMPALLAGVLVVFLVVFTFLRVSGYRAARRILTADQEPRTLP